jgi:hypothetical protein
MSKNSEESIYRGGGGGDRNETIEKPFICV